MQNANRTGELLADAYSLEPYSPTSFQLLRSARLPAKESFCTTVGLLVTQTNRFADRPRFMQISVMLIAIGFRFDDLSVS